MSTLHRAITLPIEVLLLLLRAVVGGAQVNKPVDWTEKIKPAFLGFSSGMAQVSYRDMGTSPLTYVGTPIFFALSHTDVNLRHESTIALSYYFGEFTPHSVQVNTPSFVRNISLDYLELFAWPKADKSPWSVNIGGQWSTNLNLRKNPSFLNASKGVDLISSLFALIQLKLDLNQGKASVPRLKRTFEGRLGISLMNATFRHGFAYLGQGAILNNDDFLMQYEWRLFSGFRANGLLRYTQSLRTTNAIQLTYVWDAYSVKGYHELDVAQHLLEVSFLYRLK